MTDISPMKLEMFPSQSVNNKEIKGKKVHNAALSMSQYESK